MISIVLFTALGAGLVGLGLYGVITHPQLLRKIVAFNLLSAGVFLCFGIIARRSELQAIATGGERGLGGDPVPQAMVITGIVVAFAGTAMAVALLVRYHALTGRTTFPPVARREQREPREQMEGEAS